VHAVVITRVVLAILMSLWIRGVSAESFEFAGTKRSYSLFVPTSAAPARLIVLLHGSYGSAVYSLTLSMLESQVFAATAGHRHPYSDVALAVNRNAWQFMKANRL
jgi:poly(3-hydroxybutyrate) depolymerase